ncbi:hypothetical protein AR158_c122L [Paramecium bursaria Chlorella virus AR158]|uniref:hypothetical protein n=1 Tax=Paramecium bursaria Chlorella virus AR158 TaxID=380598 RepID=UPI00015AA7DF|nr:hypothetical protein AR158_c122L [Paramecium bursaria Chlorella virus AR158]ABU43668.1 hypothetical protein AR158_c122L [Paramecium bursaria Chlorella virus AR158]
MLLICIDHKSEIRPIRIITEREEDVCVFLLDDIVCRKITVFVRSRNVQIHRFTIRERRIRSTSDIVRLSLVVCAIHIADDDIVCAIIFDDHMFIFRTRRSGNRSITRFRDRTRTSECG